MSQDTSGPDREDLIDSVWLAIDNRNDCDVGLRDLATAAVEEVVLPLATENAALKARIGQLEGALEDVCESFEGLIGYYIGEEIRAGKDEKWVRENPMRYHLASLSRARAALARGKDES